MIAIPLSFIAMGSMHAKETTFAPDTIVMEFGDNATILVLVESPEDLELLQNYDINQMLKEMAMTIESSDDETDYLAIEDEEGDRYLRDTTIVLRNRDRNRQRTQARIKLAGYEVEVDDFEDLGEDLEDMEFSKYEKKERIEKRGWGTRYSFNVELGLNNWLENGKFPDGNNAQYTVKPWGSWYVGLASTHKTSIGGPVFLEWGANLAWFNWKFDDTTTRVNKEDDQVAFSNDPSVSGIKSKLSTTYINAHLVPMLDFSYGTRKVETVDRGSYRVTRYKKRGFRIGAGVYGGYRLGSSTKIVFKEEGDRKKDNENSNYFMNNFRYGLRGQLGYKGFDFFVNYDLNEIFSDNRGPQLNALSFGIIL